MPNQLRKFPTRHGWRRPAKRGLPPDVAAELELMENIARWWKIEWMLERAKAQARIENINQIVQDQKTAYYKDDTVHKGGLR